MIVVGLLLLNLVVTLSLAVFLGLVLVQVTRR